MKTIITQALSFLILPAILFFGTSAFGQFMLASDNANNSAYSGGFGGTGQNGGTGFNAWTFNYGSNTGSFKGNPANDGMGTTGIGTNAFGFYATGNQYLNALRPFAIPFEFNDELSFYWAMNFDAGGGGKGFDLKNGNTTIYNVNNGNSTTITTSNGTATTTYGTQPMLVKVVKALGNAYNFSMTSKSGGATYTSSFTSASVLNGFNIYIGNQNDGAGQKNIYFNNFAINNSGVFNVTSGSETYTKGFTGAGSITKSGAGTLILTGTHNYTGGTTISTGTLQLGNGGTTGTIIGNITNNAVLTINLSSAYNYDGVVSGTGSLTKQGTGTLALTANNTFTGLTTISSGTLQFGGISGTSGSVTGNILNNGILAFNRSNTLTYGGLISGTGTLTNTGIGEVTLTADNTYSGATVVLQGTLKLQGNLLNSDITIASGGTLIVDGSDVKVKSLTIFSGGNVLVNAGKSMTITNNLLTNSGGLLTLNSTSTSYSSLIVNGTLSGSGTINYNRHVNQNASTGGNDLISSPVSGQIFSDFVTGNSTNLVQDTNNNNRKLFGPFDKGTGTFVIYDTTVDGSTPLEAGLGYRAATTDNGTLTFSGTVNTSTISRTIDYSTGVPFERWNLVGNPYPSYLYIKEETVTNPHSGFLSNNASQFAANYVAVYGYDDDTSNGSNYTIWNLANTTSSSVITPGQGFFIASNVGGGSVDFTPDMRAVGSSDDFILGRMTDENNNAMLKLKMANGTQNFVTDFYFNDASTLGLDPGYDAGVFGTGAPAFSIFSRLVQESEGIDMQIQSLPYSSLGSEIDIPLGLKASQGQQITVSILESSLPESVEVYLEDTVTGISTLLNSGDFVLNTTANLTGVGRFNLRFTNRTLANPSNELDGIRIISTQNPKALIVRGQLPIGSILNLYDLQGRTVTYTKLNSSIIENHIDISNVSTGVYLATLTTGAFQKTEKIVIR
ncbi:MAG: autotransporter-associated beta strand repeat-containing protein [Gelidibacter sp.]